jgi:hypothetical protein
MAALVERLAARVPAVVTHVSDDGRRVTVVTVDGETIEFTLRRSTGRFHAEGSGPRLTLLPETPFEFGD